MTCSPVVWSRLPVGSSASRISGRWPARARSRRAAARRPKAAPAGGRAARPARRGRAAARPCSRAAARGPRRSSAAASRFRAPKTRAADDGIDRRSRERGGAIACAARRPGRRSRSSIRPRRYPAVRAARRHAAASISRRRTARPARRFRREAARNPPRSAPRARRRPVGRFSHIAQFEDRIAGCRISANSGRGGVGHS